MKLSLLHPLKVYRQTNSMTRNMAQPTRQKQTVHPFGEAQLVDFGFWMDLGIQSSFATLERRKMPQLIFQQHALLDELARLHVKYKNVKSLPLRLFHNTSVFRFSRLVSITVGTSSKGNASET